jgi:pimeloyl-ACP methyl ester carboxylesterase
MDQLGTNLRAVGFHAVVYRETQWRDLAEAIEARYRSHRGAGSLMLIGFSYGADDVLRIARQLDGNSIPVDLIITIDPVTPPKVPGNVRCCYNYFQTNGIWDLFPWLRGVPLVGSRPRQLVNVDIRRDRPDLLEPGTSHATIAANPKLHREVVARVLSAGPAPNEPENTPQMNTDGRR